MPLLTLRGAGLSDNDATQVSGEHILLNSTWFVHVAVISPPQDEIPQREVKRLKIFAEELLAERQVEAEDEITMSSNSTLEVHNVAQRLGIVVRPKWLKIQETHALSASENGCKWTTQSENDPEQCAAYMAYMNRHLTDAFHDPDGTQRYFLEDAASRSMLLSINDSRMKVRVKGTTDLIIISKLAKKCLDIFAGLLIIIELKKEITDDTVVLKLVIGKCYWN